jgi:translation initiation factor eIF-2B subunit epsilon
VGPTISCEASPFQGNVQNPWRTNPHVQSYALATDAEGLRVLLEDGNVLACHNDRWGAGAARRAALNNPAHCCTTQNSP